MAYKIKELREKKGITQTELARKSGISRTTIIFLENGEEHEPKVGTLKAIAGVLGVPVSELFY